MPDDDPQSFMRPFMRRALEIAARGQGLVEPNPMVGCVIVRDGKIVGEGWHQSFGGPHAEVHALNSAGEQARGATVYVTLEPCRHTGKTPPCTQALITAGVARVVVATRDPFPEVDGGGIRELQAARIEVQVGLLEDEASHLLAPFFKLVRTGTPWVIAKWAMTLDGKIAARDGSSQWISSPESRAVVHELRGRVDAILVGRGTATADDPLLTARLVDPPSGVKRIATRVVLGKVSTASQLVRTIDQAPLLVFVKNELAREEMAWLVDAGGEVEVASGSTQAERFAAVLAELGRRRMTNVLVEGGSQILGAALDAGQIDEVHAFVAPRIIGGSAAPSPLAGAGLAPMQTALMLAHTRLTDSGGDVYLTGRTDMRQKKEI